MNIFVLDRDPVIAAKYLCDKHIVKMCLESAQMLSTARILNNLSGPYKKTHENHPCSKWTRASRQNYNWLYNHLSAILDEYELRYNKVHAIRRNGIESELKDSSFLPNICLTKFAMAISDIYKSDNVVESYRAYYICEKSSFAKWKNSQIPNWFSSLVNKS